MTDSEWWLNIEPNRYGNERAALMLCIVVKKGFHVTTLVFPRHSRGECDKSISIKEIKKSSGT